VRQAIDGTEQVSPERNHLFCLFYQVEITYRQLLRKRTAGHVRQAGGDSALEPHRAARQARAVGKKATVEGMQDKRVLSDGTRTMELYLIQGTVHDDGIIMAYLPKEKLLIEADVFTPALPNTAPPAQPNPNGVALYDNIERLKLTVDQILPIHGRKVPLSELQKWIGKAS
jgi:hypothetical protein